MDNKTLSVIVPSFNEKENIRNTAGVISGILKAENIPYEIIFVDDGSADDTWSEIIKANQDNFNVRGIRFSRNFGKEGAIFAGLKEASGGCAAVIDCDLQHPPELLPKMYRMWENGAEIVEAVKTSRGEEGFFHKILAGAFYGIMKNSSGINLDGASDYKLLGRNAIDALNELPERVTFFRALSGWIGFPTEKIEFEVQPRRAGKTKWSIKKLFKFALNSITSFTDLPIHFITLIGVIFGIFAFVLGIQTLVKYFLGQAAEGFSTVILLLLIIGACVLIGIGIIGFYLSKIYEEIKQRPRYIISQRTDSDKREGSEEK